MTVLKYCKNYPYQATHSMTEVIKMGLSLVENSCGCPIPNDGSMSDLNLDHKSYDLLEITAE